MRRTPPSVQDLVTHLDPSGAASEAYRVLRTNLQFMGLDKPLKRILVTSAIPSEGKSTVAANLAVVFAQAGSRVCLVDADLRQPRMAKLFGVENWRGLSNLVVGQGELEEFLQSGPEQGLSLLTSGPVPPNPAELLGSLQMGAVLRELSDRFDVVVLDSPPVLAVTDAAVLAPKVDGVILVAEAGRVARQQVVQARNALKAVNGRVLGTVLNKVKLRYREGYYYNDYGYMSDGKKESGR